VGKKTCDKGRAYATKEEARRAIHGMANKWSFAYKRIYRCGACKAYHITSKPPFGRRKQW